MFDVVTPADPRSRDCVVRTCRRSKDWLAGIESAKSTSSLKLRHHPISKSFIKCISSFRDRSAGISATTLDASFSAMVAPGRAFVSKGSVLRISEHMKCRPTFRLSFRVQDEAVPRQNQPKNVSTHTAEWLMEAHLQEDRNMLDSCHEIDHVGW